ncbi:MAG: DUF6600 domain-containing protein [Candidatus Eisenbacteria bacterium]
MSHSAKSSNHLRALTLGLLLLTAGLLHSCAAPVQEMGPGVSLPPSLPAAKLALPPALRVFHDELEPYGDWVLIEPYGYVFRPDVNTVAWRPYEYGWWEPSDVFGWIWSSDEPFGWLTYHYGTWFRDDFQGWVWAPGVEWGPAWVAWVSVGDWIGWAPLSPIEYDRYNDIPGGVFVYASATQFGRDDESMRSTFVNGLSRTNEPLRQILRLGHADGVSFNMGPDPLFVQRAGGMGPTRELPPPARLDLPRVAHDDGTQLLLRSKKLFAQAEREWRGWREHGATPKPVPGGKPRPPVWREPPAKQPRVAPDGGPASADTLEKGTTPREGARFKPVPPARRDSTVGKGRTLGRGGVRKPGAKPLGGAAADSTR